jgi:hypothetical protein
MTPGPPCRTSESKARMSAQKWGNPKGPPIFCADKGRVILTPVYGKEFTRKKHIVTKILPQRIEIIFCLV